MKKSKKRLIIGIIMSFVVLIGIFMFNGVGYIQDIIKEYRIQRYGAPISSSGEINNRYFDIDSNGENSYKTTKGINEAIKYANENNIEYVKFEKGTYLIGKVGSESIPKGIVMQSNINLDLNGSKLLFEPNNFTNYSMIYIGNKENITIKNGILVGDKEKHIYATNSDNQWGFGIQIIGGRNIQINNMEIQSFIGDGIIVDGIYTENIKISNCNIFSCRRQGISITSGNYIDIVGNEIHDIKGALPQSGIDLESYKNEQKIQNINIKSNKIYNLESKSAIIGYLGVYSLNIENNDIDGSIEISDSRISTNIKKNNIKNSGIFVYNNKKKIDLGCSVRNVKIEENNLQDAQIIVEDIQNSIVRKNSIANGIIQIASCEVAVYENLINNMTSIEKSCAYYMRFAQEKNESFKVFLYNNVTNGNFKEIIKNVDINRISIITSKQELDDYLNNI